ncbi:MAG: hypothetical protein ACI8Y4_000249 [Candidatus Poriferisodalaceae bacterium]|jgi:hypothetical protein
MDVIWRIVAGAVGASLVAWTFGAAVRTVVVPRAEPVFLTRVLFAAVRLAMWPLIRPTRPVAQRQAAMGYYAPTALVLLPFQWLLFTAIGFAMLFISVGVETWREAYGLSGSSIITLGFANTGGDWPGTLLAFTEGAMGLVLVALLISFLPTMYGAFSSRERMVAFLAVRAGTPPSPVEMVIRFHRLGELSNMTELFTRLEAWFDELSETHTTFLALPWFRSPNHERSWVTSAGAALDAAALTVSTLETKRDTEAQFAIRAGYSSLREIAQGYDLDVPADPQATDEISITRAEFDEACELMKEAGLPVLEDRELAWINFSGWRVNYDASLTMLAELLVVPYGEWTSDRVLSRRPPVRVWLSLRRSRLPSRFGSPAS